jgi:hypothetical protein
LKRVYVQPEAHGEAQLAAEWYESQRPGLGTEFVLELDAMIERATATPELYALQFRNVRRVLLRRFPYAVYFVFENGAVEVFAILSQKREPALWQGRVSST